MSAAQIDVVEPDDVVGSYLVGLPVGVQVHADGSVSVVVYAEDLPSALAREEDAPADHVAAVEALLGAGTALPCSPAAPVVVPAAEHPVCDDPACPQHGVAASNRRQSEFYAARDRTVDAGPDEAVCGYCDQTVEVSGGWLVDHEVGPRGSELCNGSGSTPAELDDDEPDDEEEEE